MQYPGLSISVAKLAGNLEQPGKVRPVVKNEMSSYFTFEGRIAASF